MAIPQKIKNLANKVRTAVYGKEVRESLAESMEETANVADETKTRQDSLETQFQTVLDETTGKDIISAPEILAARGEHANLKERLDTEYNEVSEHLAQRTMLDNQGGSFVEKLKHLMNVKQIYARKINADSFGIGIIIADFLNTVIEYKFDRNTDGLFLLRGVYTGEQSEIVYDYPDVILDGNFTIPETGGTTYTTTIGDSFSFEFTGTKLEFQHRVENRGGLWEFELRDGFTSQKRYVSCYSETAAYPVDLLFDGLPNKTYQVTARFLGDDPNNPPSSTPSRGFLQYNPDDSTQWPVRTLDENSVNVIDDATKRELVSSDSIPDFAISAKPKDATFDHVWVPKHSTVGGVSTSVVHKIVLDGDIYVIDNVPTDGMEIKHFFLTHRFNAVNPNGGGTMWLHYVTHTISDKSPYIEITNRIEIAQDLAIQNMYFGMLPVNDSQVLRLVLNNGTEYNKPFPTSSTFIGADTSSFLYVGSYEAGRGHATAIDNLSYSEAVGLKQRTNYEETSLLTFRNDGVDKAYFSVIRNGEVKTGDIFSNTHRIIVVGGLHFPNELLKQM